MTVFLVVDGIQCFPHEPSTKATPLYTLLRCGIISASNLLKNYLLFRNIADLVNQSNPFVITCCSCTIATPINDFILPSPQKRIFLPVSALDGFKIFKPTTQISRQLVQDMGGHGRALEILNDFKDLDDYSKIMNGVIAALDAKYPSWSDNSDYFLPLLRVILSRYPLSNKSSKIPELGVTVDEICGLGLFDYCQEEKILMCPYVWLILMARKTGNKFIQKFVHCQIESMDAQFVPDTYYLPTWQQWEKFNGIFHCLKSKVFKGQKVSLRKFHAGALCNLPRTLKMSVKQLQYVQSSKQIDTKNISMNQKIRHDKGNILVFFYSVIFSFIYSTLLIHLFYRYKHCWKL